jgi:uroporphyrinogen-III synthase
MNSAALKDAVARGDISLAAFTSASSVRAFANAVGHPLLAGVRAASIGPVTSDALREAGIDVVIEAESSTLDGLVKAILLASSDEHIVDAIDVADDDEGSDGDETDSDGAGSEPVEN